MNMRSLLSTWMHIGGMVFALCATSAITVFATTPASPDMLGAQKNERVEAPDGAPTLPKDNAVVSSKTVQRGDAAAESEAVSEEKIENRLAVIRSGRSTVTDPNAGRYDRAAAGGARRITPATWELFRF